MNFKVMIESALHKIDSFFKEKSQKDIYMIYVMVAAVLFAAAYPFYNLSFNEFNDARKKVTDVTAKINEDKIYLNVNTEAKVAKIDQDIKSLEAELVVQKNKNSYIKNKIETISSLIYDEKAWGAYLNSISINAKKHDIHIINFANSYSENNSSAFGHVLDISLEVKGNYLDTVKFINSLEQSELVVDIHDFSIKAQNALNSDINISVWGITYR
ncbi:MAG: type 4a pilus biogenesis protein PilO [Sulfurimonas sp.]|uniref:type 4a pilus biogenesis protein PilO n=1 Tax=Sulfurimonas sp. TaxID=2022749 RepID=UPI00262E763D|nr:type 4a pilus biogenesis protein PilO [Sulfurimonas sp.]MDD5373882.1 type 4a pilus biogenesis protein PilO [Sulfurimonas sp.]